MKNLSIFILIAAFIVANFFVSYANTKKDIEKANKKGNIVFLVMTEKGNSKNQEAMNIAQKAQKSVPKSAVLELDRSNSENNALIQEYGLLGAPAPLILVIASNGYIAGGALLSNLSAESLIKMVPSPKEEAVIKALNEGNSVFIVFSSKSALKNKKQLDVCQSACQIMGDRAKTVNVNIDDKKEKSFISKFKIDNNTEFPITFVVNVRGQVTSMFNGITESKNLVDAAKKVVNGCGPSGCGPTCK